jgi:type I restriction enzyme R subunit
MQKFGEYGVEQDFMDWLEEAGWNVFGEPKSDTWGAKILDQEFDRDDTEVVYWDLLEEQLIENNKDLRESDAAELVEKLKRGLSSDSLLDANESFYEWFRNGVQYTVTVDDEGYDGEVEKTDYFDLVDLPEDGSLDKEYILENNRFDVVNQFQVKRGDTRVRPDVTLLVNGIPIVHVELKSIAQGSYVEDGIRDMKDYESDVSRLFATCLLNVVSDGERFRYAGIGAREDFYFPWRPDNTSEDDYEVRDAVKNLLDPSTLMDVFKYFVFFEDEAKIIPRYMQYYATNEIINRIQESNLASEEFIQPLTDSNTLEHIGSGYSLSNLDIIHEIWNRFDFERNEYPWPDGDLSLLDRLLPSKGLIWHTQGSGKSYTMIFTGHKIKKHPDIKDRQNLLIVDRKKLEEQMGDTLHEIDYPNFHVADSIDDLEERLAEGERQVVLTTIQKFEDVDTSVEIDSDVRPVVLVDEAHRFTEGKLGSQLKAAISDPYYFGFTGTPVAEGKSPEDRNTFDEFSPEGEEYLHRYSIQQGQRDNVIVPVSFTLKDLDWNVPEERLDEEFEGEFGNLPLERRREILKEYVNQAELAELRPRVEEVVRDIKDHFESKVEKTGFKGMIVTPSRRAAAIYCDELRKYWDSDKVEAVISSSGDDEKMMQKYHKSGEEERQLVENFKEADSDLKMLVVCDKLLTGFDAPILKTMYLDKEMKNHNLLQAIARVNRPIAGKRNGEIVDYQGIFADPEEALNYDLEFVENVAFDTDKLADDFLELLDDLIDLFDDVKFNGSSREFRKALSLLQRNDEKASEFLKLYSEASDIFVSVTPHEKLGQQEVLKKWEVIEQIQSQFKRLRSGENPGSGSMDDDVREKTRDILEKNIDVSVAEGVDVDYSLQDADVEKVKRDEPDFGAAAEGQLLEKNIEIKRDENPVYPRLSERVREVIDKWKNEDISSEEALEEFDKIKDEEEGLRSEQKELGLNDVEFAIYKLLDEEFREYVDEDDYIDVSKVIGSTVSGMNTLGKREEVIREIRKNIITKLTSEGYISLVKAEEKKFLDEAPDYIYENLKGGE